MANSKKIEIRISGALRALWLMPALRFVFFGMTCLAAIASSVSMALSQSSSEKDFLLQVSYDSLPHHYRVESYDTTDPSLQNLPGFFPAAVKNGRLSFEIPAEIYDMDPLSIPGLATVTIYQPADPELFRTLEEFRSFDGIIPVLVRGPDTEQGSAPTYRMPQLTDCAATRLQDHDAFSGRYPGTGNLKTIVYWVPFERAAALLVIHYGASWTVEAAPSHPGEPAEVEAAYYNKAMDLLDHLRFDVVEVSRLSPGITPGPLSPCRAVIHLPSGLKPGEVLSPTYTITAADGTPAKGEIYPVLYIGGQQAHSVVWDGRKTIIELQVSCQGYPLSVTAVMPAFGSALPVGVPGLGGIGVLPGPATLTEGLIGVLAPGLLAILIGLLGGRSPAIPGRPPDSGSPEAEPGAEEDGASPRRGLGEGSMAERVTGLGASRKPPLVVGGLLLPDFPEFPDGPGLSSETPQLDPGGETLADKIMNAVGDVIENPYVQATGQTIGQVGTALKDGVVGFAQGLAMIPQGIVSMVGNILGGYVEVGRLCREVYNDVSSGRSIIGGRSILGVGLDTMSRSWDDLWSSVGKEMLPVEEFKTILDNQASLEERLWAIPSAAVKTARLLMLPVLRDVAVAPVPGLSKAPSLIPSVRTAQSLERFASVQHGRATEIEKKLAEIRADPSVRPGKARTITRDLESSLAEARSTEATIRGVGELNGLAPGVSKTATYQQVQRVLDKNPRLTAAVDDLIRTNEGGQTLYDLRRSGLMGKDAHTLITARKLQLQDQVMQAAQKRMLVEEARAIMEQGGKPPTSFHTFNATQGSRTLIRGSNVNADLDSTLVGMKHVSRDRCAQILREECSRAGFSQKSLDVNIYRPRVGLADPGGAAPNVQVTLENIGQTTGTGGRYQLHVTAKGEVVVSPHVSQQGRESVLQARSAQSGKAGSTDLAAWQGHQGRPVAIPREHWDQVRKIQTDGLRHAYESGEMNQMVKYANRAQSVGLPLDPDTARLVRAVAGQKDPFEAGQMLHRAGIRTPADLMVRLGQKVP